MFSAYTLTRAKLLDPSLAGKTDREITALILGSTSKTFEPNRTPAEALEARKSERLFRLAEEKQSKEFSTFVSGGHAWQCDRESRTRLYGLGSLREADFPADRAWRTAANVDVDVTYAYTQGLLADLEAYTHAVFQASLVHRLAIQALTTQEQVNAYDVTTGWPANTL